MEGLRHMDFKRTVQSLLLLVVFTGLDACRIADERPPNFLIILVDDLGIKDLGCYGQEYIQTPNIDRLSEEGMRWENAYSACPVCSPTRVAILTGKNPARVHFTGHITAIGRHRYPDTARIIPPSDLMYIPLEEVSLAEALKPAGYVSISIGKWHVGDVGYWPEDQGFDENIGGWTHGSPPSHFYPYVDPDKEWNPSIPTLRGGQEGEYLTDRLTDEAIRFMDKNRDNPFLLYLPYYAVHTPLQAPDSLVQIYDDMLADKPIDPVYAAMVHSLDSNVGRLMAALERLKLREQTLVIFASDNGGLDKVTDNSPYRLGKGHLYEGGIRVPLIMRWPGNVPSNTVNQRLTITEDIYATIVDIVGEGARPGAPLDGRSLVPDFSATRATDTATLYWYYPHYSPQAYTPGTAIRAGRYKLIEFYDPPGLELYDLVSDPGERDNVADANPMLRDSLRQKLQYWLGSVDALMHTPNPDYAP
jgi:arylsulfatase A-like enzyme